MVDLATFNQAAVMTILIWVEGESFTAFKDAAAESQVTSVAIQLNSFSH